MQEVFLVIELVIAIALVIVILMQKSEGGAASLTGGGNMGGLMSVRGAANFLTRLTAILAAAFMATSLILAVLAGNATTDTGSVMDKVKTEAQPPSSSQPSSPSKPEAAAPAKPEQPAAPSVPFSE
ncbi:MAG: preprotein translocase subunit SecG [Alphaproteobacteria bacterium]|nr:preprotein translocase subunit SecG [Alphaproteobacteria bacterium]